MKYLHIIRITGDRTAKITRYKDKGFFIAVMLPYKLAEGRKLKVNKFGFYSDFYFGIVESVKYERKVKDCHNLSGMYAILTDPFIVEIFENRYNKYYRLKNRLIKSIEERELKGIANKVFKNLRCNYVIKSGFKNLQKNLTKSVDNKN